jgi:biotin carboxyl carrier protein
MKSYWISAAVVLLTAWPLSSTAYVAGQNQATSGDTSVQQAQASTASANAQSPAQKSMAAKTEVAPAAAAAAPASTAPAPANTQSKGSYMLVELTKGLTAKKLKPGDKVKAEVAQDVVSHGKVIIPVETELIGHVTEVCPHDSANPESRLGIVFDKILLKHFHDINFQAVVQTVAPPAPRPSRVDQPSQMLPPSMIVGARDNGNSPIGGMSSAASRRGQASTGSNSTTMSQAYNTTTFPSSITVKQSPSNHADGSSAQLETTPGGSPMSVGMPLGVRGLKGLSLSTAPSASTPGPVIVSNTDNVKLESGTQILLHVLKVEIPTTAEKAK